MCSQPSMHKAFSLIPRDCKNKKKQEERGLLIVGPPKAHITCLLLLSGSPHLKGTSAHPQEFVQASILLEISGLKCLPVIGCCFYGRLAVFLSGREWPVCPVEYKLLCRWYLLLCHRARLSCMSQWSRFCVPMCLPLRADSLGHTAALGLVGWTSM